MLVEQYIRTLTMMQSDLSRQRPSASVREHNVYCIITIACCAFQSDYASEANAAAEAAFKDAESVAQKAMAFGFSIQTELKVKIREMQSFSAKELGNIPRKCELIRSLQARHCHLD